MFRSIQTKFAHHALNTIGVFTQSGVAKHLVFFATRYSEILRLCLRMGIMAKNCCTIEKKNICARGVMHTIVEGFQQWGDWMVKKALSSLWAYTG